MSEQPSPQRNRLAISALVTAVFTLLIALGTLFLSIHNKLEQNKLQLLPTTIPSLAKEAARAGTEEILGHSKQQFEQQQKALTALQQDVNHLQQKRQSRIDLDATLAHIEQAQAAAGQLQGVSTRIETLKPAPTGSTWYQQWWHNIRSLFVVRRLNNDSQTLLSPQQVELVKASVELQLDLTEWAAIHSKPNLFKRSLKQANKLIADGFEKNAALSQLQHALQQLQATTWKRSH